MAIVDELKKIIVNAGGEVAGIRNISDAVRVFGETIAPQDSDEEDEGDGDGGSDTPTPSAT